MGRRSAGRAASGLDADELKVSAAAAPRGVDHVRAAALPGAGLAAWQSLFGAGSLELSAGQTLLILGAAGGVGSFAVQLAKWKGARVVAAGRSGQQAHLRTLGADVVLDTAHGDLSGAGEVDAVLDLLGGADQKRAWAQLKPGGAFASTLGPPPADEAAARAARTVAVFTQVNAQHLGEIARLAETGVLKVFVTESFRSREPERRMSSWRRASSERSFSPCPD